MRRTQKTLLVLVAVVLIAVAVGSSATASNFAFKINQIVYRSSCALCQQWLSLPANNPYAGKPMRSAGGLCDTNGNGAVGSADPTDLFQIIAQQGIPTDPGALDSTQFVNCTLNFGNNPVYDPARGAVRVTPKGPFPAADQSWIVVGSHQPGKQTLVRAPVSQGGSCNGVLCDNWVDLWYHTTYTTLRNACDSNGDGISQTDATDKFARVSQQGTAGVPGAVDSIRFITCSAPFGSQPLGIGRAVRISIKTPAQGGAGDVVYSQPHF